MPRITTVRDFSRQSDYNAFSVVRVHNRYVAELGGRHAWIRAHWRHPTTEYRVTYRLALLSVVLGLVGFILGIINLVR